LRVLLPAVLVADVLDEEQHQHVVLVLTRVHPPAERVTTGPERGVELGLLEGHGRLRVSRKRRTERPGIGAAPPRPQAVPGASALVKVVLDLGAESLGERLPSSETVTSPGPEPEPPGPRPPGGPARAGRPVAPADRRTPPRSASP